MAAAASWSDLPHDLLTIIFERLSDASDLQRCLVVSSWWRSTAKSVYGDVSNPSLLLLEPKEDQLFGKVLGFGKNNNFPREFGLCPPKQLINCALLSSYNGWLLVMHQDSTSSSSECKNKKEYTLYNPITRMLVRLPSLPRRKRAVCLFLTSTSPTDSKCVIFVHYQHVLASCKLGDKSWNVISTTKRYHDMIFYKGEFYAVDFDGVLSIFKENEMKRVETSKFGRTISYELEKSYYYFVEESGELLIVEMGTKLVGICIITMSFRIFKLKWRSADNETTKWEEVSTFGSAHQALFLQRVDSMLVSASEYANYKPNCIYFIHYYHKVWDPLNHFMVYDLENRTRQFIYFNPSNSKHRMVAHSMCRWFKR